MFTQINKKVPEWIDLNYKMIRNARPLVAPSQRFEPPLAGFYPLARALRAARMASATGRPAGRFRTEACASFSL
jgi:hypothetical protein